MKTHEVDGTEEAGKRERFLVVGERLSVKLSYLNGILTGMETYWGEPEAEYWKENYTKIPRVVYVTHNNSVGFAHPHGVFAFHQGKRVHATELIGRGGAHMPREVWNYARVKRASVKYMDVPRNKSWMWDGFRSEVA